MTLHRVRSLPRLPVIVELLRLFCPPHHGNLKDFRSVLSEDMSKLRDSPSCTFITSATCDCGTSTTFLLTSHDRMAAMPIYGNLLLRPNKRPMTLKVGMQHRMLEYYQVCSNNDPGLTLTYFGPLFFCNK